MESLKILFSDNQLKEYVTILTQLLMVLINLKVNKAPIEDSTNRKLFNYAIRSFLTRFLRLLNLNWEGENCLK